MRPTAVCNCSSVRNSLSYVPLAMRACMRLSLSGGTLGPLRMAAGAGDGLNDRQVHGFEKFDGPALSDRHALHGQGAHAVAERADQAVDAWLSLRIQDQLSKGCRWSVGATQAVAEHRQHITALAFDGLDQGLDELPVAAHPVRA